MQKKLIKTKQLHTKGDHILAVRKHVWYILSQSYLDTAIDISDIIYMGNELAKSNLSISEIRDIDRYEVLPVLKYNLISPAGVWTDFDKEWLFKECHKMYTKRNHWSHRLKTGTYNFFFYKHFRKKFWTRLEEHIH